MDLLLDLAFIVLGLMAGLGLGLLTAREIRKTKRGGAIAFAASVFMAMNHFTPRSPTVTYEPADDTKIKKGANPGDPPEPEM